MGASNSKKITRKDAKKSIINNTGDKKNISDEGQKLMEIESHLRSRNGFLIAMIFLVFIFITASMFNTYYQLKGHSCIYSSVDKCIAADKFCAQRSQVTSLTGFGTEFITNQEIKINPDYTNVINQTVNVGYYKTTDGNIGTSIFPLDFNFTDSVPSGGTGIGMSNLLNMGPSAGFYINQTSSTATGISFYLQPYENLQLSGTSIGQISYIINQGFSIASANYNNIIYSDNPLGKRTEETTKSSGIIFISGNEDDFQIGTFITEQFAVANLESLNVKSNLPPGTSVVFTNFKNSQKIPYEKTISYLRSSNITQNIKLSNYRNNKYCGDTSKIGCTCVEPGTKNVPNCRDYYFDDSSGKYIKTGGSGVSVRFCSYSSGIGIDDNAGGGMQVNEPPANEKEIGSIGGKPTYYFNGYSPGRGTPDDESVAKNRYQLPAIFCSNATELKDRTVKENGLYDTNPKVSNLANVYNSSQPNYIKKDGSDVVALGHQAP